LRLAEDAGIEPGVFDGHGDARGHQAEQALMLAFEVSNLAGLNIDDADHTVLGDQWNRQFGPHVRIHVEIIRLFADVVNQDGLAKLDGTAGDSFAHLRTHALGFSRVTNLKADAQVLRLFIHQKDGEVFKRQDSADEVGNALQESIQLESGIESISKIEQEPFQIEDR